MTDPSSASETTSPQKDQPVLDDLMLAMDVVDTLRHNEKLALDELAQEGRDETLKERLKKLYESQGLTVSDQILDEGIRALKEDRFTYKPPSTGFSRTFANIWINRKIYAGIVLSILAFGFLLAGYNSYKHQQQLAAAQALQIELQNTLPEQLTTHIELVRKETKDPEALQRLDALTRDGQAALQQKDAQKTKAVISKIGQLYNDLVRTYRIRIVSEPNSRTAVYRIPDANTRARNYYLIVEAIGSDGKPLALPITSEENGQTKIVTRWGQRVPAETYERVFRDKQDDGIIQNRILGEKVRGTLKPSFSMPAMNGAITQW